MASRFYGIARGEAVTTISSSTTSKEIELEVVEAASAGIDKQDVILALEMIVADLKKDAGYPA